MKLFEKNTVLIFIWIALSLFIISSDGISAEYNLLSNFFQISLSVIIIVLGISLFVSFYFSVTKKKIKYFSRMFITVFILIISLVILNSNIGSSVTNIIRGTPKTIAEFRGVRLILRDNGNFDIWYPQSFPLLSVKNIYAGNYITDNEEIKFLYDNEIPNYFSSNAKFEVDNINRKVVRFIFSNEDRFDYYIIN